MAHTVDVVPSGVGWAVTWSPMCTDCSFGWDLHCTREDAFDLSVRHRAEMRADSQASADDTTGE